ncbi:MAG: 5-oxoprolinase/urea amidolyase family protein [Bryobacteraceae bacterium]|nr:5-oxoprolinase/urea amidolyase family protein [Bryobacteraceae bacterium]
MFSKVLIANRGAIACRIIRTLRKMGIGAVAVYSDADRHSLHVAQADEAIPIGPPPAAQSYLRIDAILDAARRTGAQAIHPGYGFLSENAGFAEQCQAAGFAFIGPTPEQMRAFGLKHTARALAAEHHVPMLPGTSLLRDAAHAAVEARRIGYPVMLKSTAGGGGIGMRVCRSSSELEEAYETVDRLSRGNFAQAGIYLERFVDKARHIEVQIFGDGRGEVLSLGERDCSAQRRNQKVIEETPAPGLKPEVRNGLIDAAVWLGKAVSYRSAGTVEFVFDDDTHEFYFLEVNTRLQVEHGVTEEVTGLDIVEWMVRLAAGEMPPLTALSVVPRGHSIQVRVYAEDPARDFQPNAGLLSAVTLPDTRCETWVEAGTEVTPFYDPMLAKIIVRGDNRAEAVARLEAALAETRFEGIETNLHYLRQIAASPRFQQGGITTSYLKTFPYRLDAFEVLEPGTQTTVQDYPGRLGYWHVGVPPSGPMDSLAFRLANRLVGNPESAAALECTMTGPSLKFHRDGVIALTGADMGATLNGEPVPRWQAVQVPAGGQLQLGHIQGHGARAYIAVRGGINVPEYLGSRATFILGQFGGHAGRVLRAGDLLRWRQDVPLAPIPDPPGPHLIPTYSGEWELGVQYGPHGAPDFFTADDIALIFSTPWKVHYNSDRTGVRLIGPKPKWARHDGGEAGLHPSNIHDNAYAIGTMDFTGDMPVLLGPDGPSLGGFVCPATIVQSELWKMGQLRPGDTVRLRRVDDAPAIVRTKGDVVCRRSGDRYLLIELGENRLDLNLRVRVHALEQSLRAAGLPGMIDITPGIRSLQIHYDNRALPREALLEAVEAAESALPPVENIVLPSRIVHMPLSWDDPATQLAIRKYMQSVRPDAPWCPSNIEFIRRINGLDSIDDVRRVVFDASYLVMGLGDVYLGAPVATPLDPRHRLVTTKYNPARTWTAQNSVGIGGAYLCIYGMEGPGGYQFVGRTVQVWNARRQTPWLLRCFDQIRFYPVTAAELLELRDAFPHGKFELNVEPAELHLGQYRRFLDSIAQQAAACKSRQQAAFLAERERWAAAGLAEFVEPPEAPSWAPDDGADIGEGCAAVRSPITASVWQINVEPGQRVDAGQKLVILEAMKMEVAVVAPTGGIVQELRCVSGGFVTAGQNLVTLRLEEAA